MYADDTQVLYLFYPTEYHSALAVINNDLEKLSNVSSEHSLVLNPSKSAVILFSKKTAYVNLRQVVNIKIKNFQIKISDSAKNLGLILDKSLRFQEHVTYNIQMAYTALRLLYPHRLFLNSETKKMLCETLVLSQFTYCAPVYGP